MSRNCDFQLFVAAMSGDVVLDTVSSDDGFLLDNQGMLIRESKAQLEQMLAVTGADARVGARNPGAVMNVFERFAAMPAYDCAPVDEDGDGVLAQFGTYGVRGIQEFNVDLTRQFIEAGDDDAPTWQLSCTFYWDPTPETLAMGSDSLWSFDFALEDFFRNAALLPGWEWALGTNEQPKSLEITLDQV
ncbi:hypothetical protein LN996_11395 [Arthrobacter sp. AK01]|uniref:hypothetical protein n=2 Tax=Micrococcaceae TaxID=1268 RepID=UPI001E59761A|nr:hypothetical protein [Arthrobacter sp. AK01]MCD4851416.1 hypothetical protein [Arthrobacter sp. AK01]